jgi:hypothetical protein
MMLDQNDPAVRAYQQGQERAKAAEEGRKANVRLFTEMYFALGADAAKLPYHREELEEAMNLASWRWSKLLDLEAQAKDHPELQADAKRERKELESFIPKKARR